MAKQRGVFPITGMMDQVVFYKTTDEGYLVKTKGTLSKERVKTAPEFEGSRRASTAFTRAARATKLLRLAMGGEALQTAESRMAGRMNGKMMRILKADKQAATMDEKLVGRGDLQLLLGHAWNRLKLVKSAVSTLHTVSIDRGLGELEVHFPSLHAKNEVSGPGAATHYEIFVVGALVDFEGGYIQNDESSSGVLPINNTVRTISIRCNVEPGSTLPMILGMGVVFYQEQNGVAYRLNEGACFEIVGVDSLTR
jgi:hypothetical protein